MKNSVKMVSREDWDKLYDKINKHILHSDVELSRNYEDGQIQLQGIIVHYGNLNFQLGLSWKNQELDELNSNRFDETLDILQRFDTELEEI